VESRSQKVKNGVRHERDEQIKNSHQEKRKVRDERKVDSYATPQPIPC
jgi:hypothetical protein